MTKSLVSDFSESEESFLYAFDLGLTTHLTFRLPIVTWEAYPPILVGTKGDAVRVTLL